MTPSDRHTLVRKLGYLRKSLDLLGEYRRHTRKRFLSSLEDRLIVERLLQTAIESVIDCSRLLVLQNDWRRLRDEHDALIILAEKKVLPRTLVRRLLQAKGFRNILVHEYVEVDPVLVFRHLQRGLPDLRAFAKHMAKWLQEQT